VIRLLSFSLPVCELIPVVIAIGGNALYDKTTGNNLNPLKIAQVCDQLLHIIQAGYLPIITFGNGPQVGNLLDMAETSARMFTDAIPLDVCVAWTQGEIGYALSVKLTQLLKKNNVNLAVVALNTTVAVKADDPAFLTPSKPVGRFISPEEADLLYTQRGWIIGPDANRGYRRLVPSPLPLAILEAPVIETLVSQQTIVLCCGGGGIPVCQSTDHSLKGVEAVIDKDYTSCLLATTLAIPNLLICTEVDNVYLHYGSPQQSTLTQVSLAQADQYIAEGHFAAGSMGPKVKAMVQYLKAGSALATIPRRAIITSLHQARQALLGHAGTVFGG
jgi:carbamate kinase